MSATGQMFSDDAMDTVLPAVGLCFETLFRAAGAAATAAWPFASALMPTPPAIDDAPSACWIAQTAFSAAACSPSIPGSAPSHIQTAV